ncbi:MAG: hypothetical protein DCC55_08895 [Chloroflexi bacterium]|nr:MAG: hypothetical protein DCC55_08895 [Chloroflexota bacterium]
MRANVKPFTRWVIARRYTVRFQRRAADAVSGIVTTPAGEIAFLYDPQRRIIQLPGEEVVIDEYGWEIKQDESS